MVRTSQQSQLASYNNNLELVIMIAVDVGQHFDRFTKGHPQASPLKGWERVTSSIRPSNLLSISMPPSGWTILIASGTVTSINGIIKLYV